MNHEVFPYVQMVSAEMSIGLQPSAHRCERRSFGWASASDAVPAGFEREDATFRTARLSLEVFLDFRAVLEDLISALGKIPAADAEARWDLCNDAAEGDSELAEAIAFEIHTMDFSDSLMYYLLELEAAGVSMTKARCYSDHYVKKLRGQPVRVSLPGASNSPDTPVEGSGRGVESSSMIEMTRDQSLDILLNLLDAEVQARMGSEPLMVLNPGCGMPAVRQAAGPASCSAPTGCSSVRQPAATAPNPGLVQDRS
ncbi:hypothetical protein [Streptomyces sp. NPDC088847]|uniref:hypothetical protein n=1 Tax=Streptomyces sp. NPDC088847 TaxID=3365909 RepID=UPI003826D769